jgi:hypothetical protein
VAEFKGGGNRKWDGILEKDAVKVKWGMSEGTTATLKNSFAQRPTGVFGASPRAGAGAAAKASSSASSGVGGATGRSPYARPVNVKLKPYDKGRAGGKNMSGVLLRYMEKDGRLFGREEGVEIDREEKSRQWEADRLLWHAMVSPNDGHMMSVEEMQTFARDTVSKWEERLGPLDWVAVVEEKPDAAHPDGNKHLHIAIRGVRDEHDLKLDRALFTDGLLRTDAMEAATDRLGYMSEREVIAYERQLEEGRERRGENREHEIDRSRVERAMDEEMDRYMTLDRNDELWEQP